MKRIAVLTSGGDAPGMNAAIRAVVRTGLERGWEVFGVKLGFAGLIEGDINPMYDRSVSEIMQRAGTILGSARCREFMEIDGRAAALQHLEENGIEALVVIGGNGSQTGSYALTQMGFPVVGIASTIDNDLYGTEMSIGVDSALNVALEAIDRLKVTASSHKRAFLIEVMGRHCGYIALMTGIAGGAEAIVLPEVETNPEELAAEILKAREKGKAHAIIVVAEGARYNAEELSHYFKLNRDKLGFDLRVSILGHIQRGGTPTLFDRMLATRFGAAATECLDRGEDGVLVGLGRGEIITTPLAEVVSNQKKLDLSLLQINRALAR